MDQETSHYGLWSLMALHSAIFVIFVFSFTYPRIKREWRSFGAFAGFIIALFGEMYGFPLTIYLLSSWVGGRFRDQNILVQSPSNAWNELLGLEIDMDDDPFDHLSTILIAVAFLLLVWAWKILHAAQTSHTLAATGPYAYIRHPQYLALIVIMLGLLFQWPTLLTLAMFPVLTYMYVRLAYKEESDAAATFGEPYARYAATTPAFIPRFRKTARVHL